MSATCHPRHIQIDYRPGTQDEEAFREVMSENCYRLPSRLRADDVVVDVGAHIGNFSLACILRGAGRVLAFEPDRDNFRYLTSNLERWIGATARNAAVWRSDKIEQVHFTGYPAQNAFLDAAPYANACGSCMPQVNVSGVNERRPVESVPLDQILEGIAADGKRVRLLKLDCEGAEFPILYTSKRLDLVDEICGELHDFGLRGLPPMVEGFTDYDMDEMAYYLEGQGFDVDVEPNSQSRQMFLFWARR